MFFKSIFPCLPLCSIILYDSLQHGDELQLGDKLVITTDITNLLDSNIAVLSSSMVVIAQIH